MFSEEKINIREVDAMSNKEYQYLEILKILPKENLELKVIIAEIKIRGAQQ